jgi:prephenate dehydratase
VTLTRVSTSIGEEQAHRIVYQGEPGSNSHLACQESYPAAEAVACPSFEDCFAAVDAGDADLAMIPIDNSLAGRVADIHHFLPTSRLHIVASTSSASASRCSAYPAPPSTV